MQIVITGATAGIGLAAARSFCEDGHQVIGIARGAEALSKLEAELPGFSGVACDIANDLELSDLQARVAAESGEGVVDVLINNAGYGTTGPVELVPLEDWKAQYAPNVFGTIGVTQAMLPLLRKAPKARILNISSVAGSVFAPFFAPYYSTKHALNCITQCLRVELRNQGIRVVLIEPGAVKTGFANHEDAVLVQYAIKSELYRDDIDRVVAWHKDLVKQGVGAEKVVETIRKAVYAERPKNRYVVPRFPNLAFIAMARLFTSKMMDAFLVRLMKLSR